MMPTDTKGFETKKDLKWHTYVCPASAPGNYNPVTKTWDHYPCTCGYEEQSSNGR